MQVQASNSSKREIACDSMPITKVSRSVPREQHPVWISGYGFLEFEQCQMISLISQGKDSDVWGEVQWVQCEERNEEDIYVPKFKEHHRKFIHVDKEWKLHLYDDMFVFLDRFI